MKKLYCYSHKDFKELCITKGWNDNNIPENSIFISICGTLNDRNEDHLFKKDSEYVLNLDFDDISADYLIQDGQIFHGLNKDQAKSIVEFIDKNIGKDIYVHCSAGKSRSQGIVRFVLDCYPEVKYNIRKDNPDSTPNIDVLTKLKKVYRELGLDFKKILTSLNFNIVKTEQLDNGIRYFTNLYINRKRFEYSSETIDLLNDNSIIVTFIHEPANIEQKLSFKCISDFEKYMLH